MDLRVTNWTYLNQECILLQSINREPLELKASVLRAGGYATELQSNRKDGEIRFYSLLATKKRQRQQWMG